MRDLPRIIRGTGNLGPPVSPHKKTPSGPNFPPDFDTILCREHFIKNVSFRGWGGSSGSDSVIIAYDALLWAGSDWEKLCQYGCLHGGKNNSTGTIAASWFGALFGFKNVPKQNYDRLENARQLKELAKDLFTLRQASPHPFIVEAEV